DEVLAQHRNVDRVAHLFEILERAAESPSLGEHTDRGRSACLVRDRQGGGIGDVGESSAARTLALDLGDDFHGTGGGGGASRPFSPSGRLRGPRRSPASATAPATSSSSNVGLGKVRSEPWGRT